MHRRFKFSAWLSSILVVQTLVGIPAVLGEERVTLSTGNEAAVDEAEGDEAVRRILDKKVSVDFNAAPLSQVVAKLSADYGVSAVLDKSLSQNPCGAPCDPSAGKVE